MAKKSRSAYRRFRQESPSKFDKRSFRIKKVGRHGVKLVIGCPKSNWNQRARRCRVGTRVQSILVPKARR